MEELVKSSATFRFHLEGNSSVDAVLLANTIADMADLAKSLASTQNDQAYLKMNVTPFQNGSFEVVFETICEIGESLFLAAKDATEFASLIVTAVVGTFEIKKFLKGKRARKVVEHPEQLEIHNENGEVLYVSKASGAVLNNIHIDSLVMNISKYARENNPDGGFSISSEKETVQCAKEDIPFLLDPLPIVEESICKKQIVVVELIIKKPDLLGSSKWSFRLNNRTIEAAVNDLEWLQKVHTGEIVIRAGASIKASLEVLVDVDKDGIPIEGTQRYSVISVEELIDPYPQTQF